MIFPRRSSCGCSAATRRIAPWHLHVTRDHLHLSSVQLGYGNDKTRAPHTSLRTAPRSSKCGAIDMELWLANPAFARRTTRACDLWDDCFDAHVCINMSPQ